MRVVIITMDRHIAGAVERARGLLASDLPGLELSLHSASDWSEDAEALEGCRADIREGDIILANMLFLEDHIQAILPDLEARREDCDAMLCFIAATEVVRLTRLGAFRMDAPQKGPLAFLKKLREKKSKNSNKAGAQQMAMLRRLPKILRFIPGTAQDVRAYFLTLQYWLAGSDENISNLVRFLVNRYADGDRRQLRGRLEAAPPIDYPDTGLYHPALPDRVTTDPNAVPRPEAWTGTIGLLVMRSYILAGDTEHYDAVISALEARGLRVLPSFASGLDAREAIDRFFIDEDGEVMIDGLLSLTGFSLVGGPAFNDAPAAEEVLARLDVPYVSAQAIEFQTVEQWEGSGRGLLPVESTIMVAIPELDGATGPLVFAGRASAPSTAGAVPSGPRPASGPAQAMLPLDDRIDMLARRMEALVRLRVTPRAKRKLAIVLFNFPPNGGAVGTAAFLSVFASLHKTLARLSAEGWEVEVPESVDALRARILEGNAERFGADANVAYRIPVEDYVRREPHLDEIEAQWGPAPGRQQADGSSIHVLGATFGQVFVGVQPAFGYEGDPMRLLFEKGFTPTHAFSAFYRHLREDFGAHAVLHFGTHGALEFMPGKQVGLSSACWPDRLIDDLPNVYLYAGNNPSEGTIAKRRSAATLVTYRTPPVARAGLYKGLLDLRDALEQWSSLPPGDHAAERLAPLVQAQAAELDLVEAEPAWPSETHAERMGALAAEVQELETTLIPDALHVLGEVPNRAQLEEHLAATAEVGHGFRPSPAALAALVDGEELEAISALESEATGEPRREAFAELSRARDGLSKDFELPGLIRALDARFLRPAPGGDVLRNPDVLPTGRNMHGFDPFRIPSRFAVEDGKRQAERLIARHIDDGNPLPESVAIVLWGTDNLKSGGSPIGQVLALLGAQPRFDGYGRLCGAELVSLEELGRPRIDVVVTLSGIFRDLLPLQTKLLAEAAYLAAAADEPAEMNFVRKNALAFMQAHGCDLETAALRVYSNADGAYGSNVNQLIDSGAWESEDELAETYTNRKCYAYGRAGNPVRQQALLESALSTVRLTFQNLESVELGVTTIDHYFDTLGGIGRAVRKARGDEASVPVYIGDQTRGDGEVRTLAEQVSLESRTRMLNPKWYEGMLEHGPEGVRQIEAHITNTMGWSATTGQVAPWVYKQLSQTFVLDPEMRERLARLNPKASAKLVNRLIEAHERDYWKPDGDMRDALREAGEELEDRLEGVVGDFVAA